MTNSIQYIITINHGNVLITEVFLQSELLCFHLPLLALLQFAYSRTQNASVPLGGTLSFVFNGEESTSVSHNAEAEEVHRQALVVSYISHLIIRISLHHHLDCFLLVCHFR